MLLRRTVLFLLAFAGIALSHLNAQGTTATILGTVSDSTGASIAAAAVQVSNTGTGQIQTTVTDAAGRYDVPDLPIGNYAVRASKEGFTTMVRNQVTLTVGSQAVVDFTLAIGQTQETVIVQGEVTQVETTNATVGALVDQTQMRELPLNGRDVESLIQLAPGVQNYYAGSSAIGTGTGANMREGRDPSISVAGSRPEGVAYLMDDQNLETFYNRGLGSITGTSLGVDGIGEFQTLTNTYSAQFGGNGAVMNAVSKSGTNQFHGSAYEFLRNSDLDARNFTDPASVPEYRRNQYGGTFGGPIKKDKLFFFFNYEGIQSVQGVSQSVTVPLARSSTSNNPATAAAVDAVLALYPLPTFNLNPAAGTGETTVVKNQTAHENYYLGRVDYNISAKDSLFGRYFIDEQNALYPFSGSALGLEPELDIGTNQFATIEERHIFSPAVLNTTRVSFSRTNVSGQSTVFNPALDLFPGSGRPDASLTIPGITGIGTSLANALPDGQLQNRFSEGDDLAWTKGAHNLRFGASVDRVQSDVLWPFESQSTWTFPNLAGFLAGTAISVAGTTDTPNNYPVRDFREIDFAFYAQDDWKVSSKLTLNLGLRYEPMTNPVELRDNLYSITNYLTATSYTQVPHVMITNPSWKNYDPRVGLAYDPFGDHKTSIRAGFGLFHEVLSAGVWGIGFINAPPWNLLSESAATPRIPFQNPSIDGGAAPFSAGGVPPVPSISIGYAYQLDRTPYVEQYNFTVEHEIIPSTVLSVGYIGSHGVNLITGSEQNPVPYTIDADGVYHFERTTVGSGRINPALGGFSLGVNGTNSRYNSLQTALNRRLTRNVQAQVAYTYSKCMGTGDAVLGSLSGNAPTLYSNPHDWQADYSVCGYNVTQALRVNSLVTLPFHGNRLFTGWQISGILAANTGLPFNVTDGVDQSNQIDGVPRPNYAPNNPAITVNGISYPACDNHPIIGTAAMWYNPNCFSQEEFGTLGNFGREGLYGPGLVNLDTAILKSTRIRESVNLQFRAELFNILNHTNLSLPYATLFTGTPSPTTTLGRNATAGEIVNYASPSREIQFGLKLLF
jgi:Carboxypeptidase regulatory-like domain